MEKKRVYRCDKGLVNLLFRNGFGVMTAPTIEHSYTRRFPDLLIGNGEQLYAINAESDPNDSGDFCIDPETVSDLRYFARKFAATPIIALPLDSGEWVFSRPEPFTRTAEGSYCVERKNAEQQGVQIHELVAANNLVTQNKGI